MNHALKVVTAPTAEPVTKEEAKLRLRITSTDEDTLITSLITAARQAFEDAASATVLLTTYDYALQSWPSGPIVLPRATPLVSVTSVTYTDSDDVATVWSSGEYDLDTHSYLGSIRPGYGESYPSFTRRPVNPIIVRYVAGAADADSVDQRIKEFVYRWVGFLYENREIVNVVDSGRALDLRAELSPLWAPFVSEYAF